MYTQALALPHHSLPREVVAVLHLNRAFVRLQQQHAHAAKFDTDCALQLLEQAVTGSVTLHAKAYYRQALAQSALGRYTDAKASLQKCISLGCANDRNVQHLLVQIDANIEQQTSFRHARGLVQAQRLRSARKKLRRLNLDHLRREQLNAPAWSVAEDEWRITFLPSMRFNVTQADIVAMIRSDNKKSLSLDLFMQAHAWHQPRQSLLRLLHDPSMLHCFLAAVQARFHHKQILTLSGHGGFLPCVVAAGNETSSVCNAERNRALSRMSQIVCRSCEVYDIAEYSASQLAHVDVVLTDCFDCTCLGLNVIPWLASLPLPSWRRNKSRPIVEPLNAKIFIKLLEARTESIKGVDMSRINKYRWHPTAFRIDSLEELEKSCSCVQSLCHWEHILTVDFQDLIGVQVRCPNSLMQ